MKSNETYIRILKDMRFKNPILIEGLPGIGLVGKIAAEHLAKELKATRIAEVYSPYYPHQVIMKKNGTIRMLRNVIYGWKDGKKELVILLGDVQPVTSEGQYEVTNKMLDYFQSLNVKKIFTLGGYSSGHAIDNPRVLGAATHKRLVKRYSAKGVVFGEAKGSIIGAAGMLLGLGKLRGMHGTCLMGETHGAYVDPNAAKKVLDKLCEILDIKIDMSKLEERAKTNEKIKKELEKYQKETPEMNDLSYIR